MCGDSCSMLTCECRRGSSSSMACADRGALTPVIYIVKVPATCEIAHSERRMALERGKHALEPVLELRVLVDEALRHVSMRPSRRRERVDAARQAGKFRCDVHAQLVGGIGIRKDAVQLCTHVAREMVGRTATAAHQRRAYEHVEIGAVDVDKMIQVTRLRDGQVMLQTLPCIRDALEFNEALQMTNKVHHFTHMAQGSAQLAHESAIDQLAVSTA